VFGAHFAAATAALFEAAHERGLRIASGLVLSDRRLLDALHQSPADAYEQSGALIRQFHKRGRLLYAVTPRFALSTSEAMLEVCQSLMAEHADVRFQTHINENPDEIAGVRQLFPWSRDYLDVYERFALTGRRSVLAHSVWSTDSELERMAASATSVAHCPCSNAALGSGVFPLRRHLNAGVHVSLGTDVGGGTGFGMPKESLQAYLTHRVAPASTILDAGQMLYLATRAGADALGLADETGDFTSGKAADFVYVRPPDGSTLAEVLAHADSVSRMVAAVFTMAGAESVHEVRVDGARVFSRRDDTQPPS
jgi:guanine deaminase